MTTEPEVPTPAMARRAPRDAASARFRAPTHVHNVIERRRVLEGLRRAEPRRLTVIHAPAGYGKTTLAVQWLAILQDSGALVAWLGLHGDDVDPHWFLAHLLEAVRRALPAADESIDDLAALIEQNAEDVQGYTLSTLLEVVGDHEGRVVLAFDDWHLVDEAAARRALVHLVDFAPPNLSIVLTSRRRPQLPLSRLRVRGHAGGDRRRRAALRPRRDPGVPRRAQWSAPRRRRRRAALRRYRRVGRGTAVGVVVPAGQRRPGRVDQRLLRASSLGGRVPGGERAGCAPGRSPRVPAHDLGL